MAPPIVQLQPPPQVPQVPGANVQAVTGAEVPTTITPQNSPQLQSILDQIGGGGGGELGGAIQSEALRQLKDPSVYDDELMKSAIEQGRLGLEEQFSGLREGLSGELAGRGLEYGTHAAGRFGDLATQQARSLGDLTTNILRERAASIGGARQAAMQGALGAQGQRFGQQTGIAGLLANLEGGQREELRGERGYTDYLRRQGREDAMQEALLGEDLRRGRESELGNWMQMAYGDQPGTGDLWGAAGAYGDDQQRYNDLLAMLGQAAA